MPYGTVNADVIQTSTSGGILGAGNASIMKNRIINGAMVIDQRNAGATGTASGYTVDRFRYFASQATKITWGQNYGSVTPPVGFTKYLGFKTTTAFTSGATDRFMAYQPIEGFNIADLGWGTANAKTVTLSFQVYSSVTGTQSGAILNGAGDRSYPFSFTVSSANTWTSISVTIAGDTSGTWTTDNTEGLSVYFNLGTGSTYLGTAGAWAAGYYLGVTGSVNIVSTLNNTFYITGVQLEVGSSATGFEYRQYTTELQLCQRYFQYVCNLNGANIGVGYNADTTSAAIYCPFKVSMRTTAPTLAYTVTSVRLNSAGANANSTGTLTISQQDENSMRIDIPSFTGLVLGQSCIVKSNSSGYVAASAEL